jgi:hypothetical protein
MCANRRFETSKFLEAFLILLAIGIVVSFYHWTVRTAGGFNPPGDEDYYNFLVRGWRTGHLYMSKLPKPEMLSLSDPYDPAQNGPYRLADASYFKGHYYLYFGAAPAALIMWPYFALSGHELGTTTTIFYLTVLGFLLLCLLWLDIRRRFFAGSSLLVGVAGIFVLGFDTHVLALQRRPLIWELPISSAFAFSIGALFFVIRMIEKPSSLTSFAAGACMGIAVASRPTYALAAMAFIPPLWLLFKTSNARPKFLLPGSLAFFVLIALLFSYNYIRFGSFFEFGQDYQLSGIYESKAEHFRIRYLLHNIWVYCFALPSVSRSFPFLTAVIPPSGPPGYLSSWSEAVSGVFVTFPYFFMALAVPLALLRRGIDASLGVGVTLAAVSLFFLGLFGVSITYFLVTPRYMADFSPSLALLAAIGSLSLERLSDRPLFRSIFYVCLAIAALYSLVAALLISFGYNNDLFQRTCPSAWTQLERVLTP